MNLNCNEQDYLQEKIGLACAAFEQGNEKQAKEYLQQVRLFLPCCAAVEIAIADVFLEHGKLILSHAYYLEATYREPGNERALQGLEIVGSRLVEEKQHAATFVEQTTLFPEFE